MTCPYRPYTILCIYMYTYYIFLRHLYAILLADFFCAKKYFIIGTKYIYSSLQRFSVSANVSLAALWIFFYSFFFFLVASLLCTHKLLSLLRSLRLLLYYIQMCYVLVRRAQLREFLLIFKFTLKQIFFTLL